MDLPDNIRRFLDDSRRFATLATINPDGTPQQSVIWYEVAGNKIIMNTKHGRKKERNLRRDPRASLCVEDGYRYVALRGETTLVDDPATSQADIERIAIRYSGEAGGRKQMSEQFSREERVTVHFTIASIATQGDFE